MTAPDPNSLRRSSPCPDCGSMMLWTQNAWASGDNRAGAYRCMNGHVLDPQLTRECPSCGVHDTSVIEGSPADQVEHLCHACGARFAPPQ
jgi:predicted RNA-binding Zn-ribbon protein involved in translation (DUF1610 family)